MEKPFFIMMYNQGGQTAMPIVDENDDVVFFPTDTAARAVAEEHDYCKHFGYEILSMDEGL